MKTTEAFKQTIQTHLEGRAATDSLFAASFAKEGKTIDNCITYILNTVQKSGCNGFTDGEIFGMAVHYYDEDQLEVGKPIAGRVVVNHSVQLSETEINEARAEAKSKLVTEEMARLQKRHEAKKPEPKAETVSTLQGSLF